MAQGNRRKRGHMPQAVGDDHQDLAHQASTYQIPESSPPDSENEDSMPRRKGREMAKGFYVRRRLKEGGRIGGVIIEPDQYVATGPSEKTFKMELGIIVKSLAPYHLLHWKLTKKKEHKHLKVPLYDKLQSEFQINMGDPHVKRVVTAAFAKRFRSIKHRGYKYYSRFDDKEKAKANPMEGIEPEHWTILCEHYESAEFQKASAAGKLNRSKVKVHNYCGQKSICQRIFEKENKKDLAQEVEEDQEAQEPVELKVYYDTHTKNGIWINPEAKEIYEQMTNLFLKSIENGDGLTGRQIVEEVAKPKTSYVRGLGYGFKSSTSVRAAREVDEPDINSGIQEQLENRMAEQKAEMQAQKAEMEAKMQEQEDKMQAQKEEMEDLEEKMQAQEVRLKAQEAAIEKLMRKAEKEKEKKKAEKEKEKEKEKKKKKKKRLI